MDQLTPEQVRTTLIGSAIAFILALASRLLEFKKKPKAINDPTQSEYNQYDANRIDRVEEAAAADRIERRNFQTRIGRELAQQGAWLKSTRSDIESLRCSLGDLDQKMSDLVARLDEPLQ